MTVNRKWGALTDPQLIDELTALVSRAAAAIMAVGPHGNTRTKSDLSPVTAADEAANAVILSCLAPLLPELPVVSEESLETQTQQVVAKDFILVDPLDGTREFIAGRNEFTVNLAVIAGGVPVIGLIAAPALGLIWRGIVGKGAERLTLAPGARPNESREIVPIHTRKRPRKLVAALSRSHFDADTAAFLDRLPDHERLIAGSALKFCRIAEGSADVYPRLAPTCEWDIAAGHAIIVAAGGQMTTPDGAPIPYGKMTERFRVPGFVAWGDPQNPAE
ncbi:MAG TPA: inositol monophosphatase family protein [Xanthobacteraceae bacterium]|nr:inositol monophosphatase family protein [Xanthobacteraceae bacterium]